MVLRGSDAGVSHDYPLGGGVDESDVGDDGADIQQNEYLCTDTRWGGMSLVDGSRNQPFYHPVRGLYAVCWIWTSKKISSRKVSE
jgi:hypothetical protein